MITWEEAKNLCRLSRLVFKAFPKLLLCLVFHCSRWSFYFVSKKMLSDSWVHPWLSHLLWCHPISDSLLPGYKISSWVKTNITFAFIIDRTLHTPRFYLKMLPILRGWSSVQFSSVQFISVTQSCLTLCDPMNCSMPGLLSITNSQSPPKLMSIESVMPSNHLILCRPLLLPSIFPSIRIFSNESALHIRWPNYLQFQLQHQSFQWTPRTDLL